MRLAMIGHKDFPSRSGGVEVVVWELATRLARRDCRVAVYNRGRRRGDNHGWAEGVEYFRAPTMGTGGVSAMLCSLTATVQALLHGYDLIHWAKSMNVASLRQRLYYHGKEIVLGGDMYCAVWDNDTLTPCDILKVPHHASLSSCNRKAISRLAPKTMVVSVAAGRPDERPHPYIVSLLKEYAEELHFTDAVEIPGLVEPVFHESVHIEIE